MKRPTSVVTGFTLMAMVFDGVLVYIQWPRDVFTGNLVCSGVCVLIRAAELLLCKDRSECTLAEDRSQCYKIKKYKLKMCYDIRRS